MADLVSVDWLSDNLNSAELKLLDCTWLMPGETAPSQTGYIQGAQHFDIDKIADTSSLMKHMLASSQDFAKAVSHMGISNSDHIICYDRHGIRSAPRVWWNFKTFGHEAVSILDGGLPAWVKSGHAITKDVSTASKKSQFKIKAPLLKVADADLVLNSMHTDYQIVDARPAGRFHGTTPEPRAGLRSGHIPGSFSLPFGDLKKADGTFLGLTDLATKVGSTGVDLNKPIITSCGSGVTAAGVAHVLHRLGAKDITLYDGSWTEWGASELPVDVS